MENVFPRTNLDRYARELSTIAEDFKWVHQYRFVEFFVKNCYDDLPKDWIESLEEEDEPSIRAMVGGGVKKDWPESLKTFVQDCESLRLRNRKEIDKPKQLDTEMKRTLSEKKQHEVAHMAEGIHETVTRTPKKTAVILDIGSGQGYLPTVLAHKWGYDVVAVEACEGNVKKGEEREALITQRKRKREALTNQKEGVVSYHPAYLSPDTTASELDKLLSAKNIPPTTPVCLTGLHSCGDLTPLVLKLFSASPRISSLSIVGCCYYKMGWPTPSAFPMSKPMADLATLLGPTGAQLACENSMRWPVMDAPEWQHTKDLSLNRAVLEVVLHRLYPTLVESIGIRGVSRKVTKLPFMAYAKHCLARLKYRRLDLSNATEPVDGGGHARTEEASEDLPPPLVDPTDLYLADTYAAYAPSMHRLVIWLTLRECISPILEALFIVDRALYLRDALPDTAVSVSAVFDKQESPRNVMISAVKGSNMVLLESFVCLAMAMSYDVSISSTGEKLNKKEWKSERYGNGDAVANDYLWTEGLLQVTKDPVMIRLISEKAKTYLGEKVDGVVGIFDARPGSLIGSFKASESEKAHVNHHALFLGNGDRQGLFQYEGHDTGTFYGPQWVYTHAECRSKKKDCYGAVQVTNISIRTKAKDTISIVPKDARDKGPIKGSLRSLDPAIRLPAKMFALYEAENATAMVIHFAGGINLEIPTKHLQVAKTDYTMVTLGQPVFKVANVVFETGSGGLRRRVGFSLPRTSVTATEEFRSANVVLLDEKYPVVEMGVGGPWGPVQTGFMVAIDTNTNDIAIKEGPHKGENVPRPYVGGFRHAVLVFLCFFPIVISLVLREANRASSSPRLSPRHVDVDVEMSVSPSHDLE